MFIEFYYFISPLERGYKVKTIVESIKSDLNRYFIYFFNKKLDDKIFWINKKNDYFLPKFIFQYEWKFTKLQIKELLNIFKAHWEENFIINYSWFELEKNNFLQLENIDSFLKQAPIVFEKFIKKYEKTKVIDETDKNYKIFRKTYNLFLYLNYILLKTYKNLNIEDKNLDKIKTGIVEYNSHLKLLKNRLNIDKESLEKTIVIYQNFVDKIISILNSFDK